MARDQGLAEGDRGPFDPALEGAHHVTDRIRRAVAEIELVHGGTPVRLTISAGVVQRRVDEALATACYRADRALYEAKDGGRDRVVASGDDDSADLPSCG